ncbi:MAG: signal peptidase II [Pseudomonadota bacterium]
MHRALIPVVALVVLILDQLSKWAVVFWLDLDQRAEIDVFPPYLVFRMAWNYGMNFGLMAQGSAWGRAVLIALALVISGWVWLWVLRENSGLRAQVAAGLLIGGALGNVIDRILYGAVADFLNMSCCGIDNPYAFNVADTAIFFGVVGLVMFTNFAGGKAKA